MKIVLQEGIFINVMAYNVRRPLTVGNIYGPPHENNCNGIDKFVNELSPVIDSLQKDHSKASHVGDYDINLL